MEPTVLHYVNQNLNDRPQDYKRGMSYEMQLYATYHELAKIKETTKITWAVVLDFKKVFHKVPHTLLMHKLKLIPDIHYKLVNWIQDFLTHKM